MKKTVRLYNILLPVWLLWIYPPMWLVILPGNLAIDCAVLILALLALGCTAKRAVAGRVWWKIWLLGFLADAVGLVWMLLGLLPPILGTWDRVGEPSALVSAWENTVGHITHNAFVHPAAFLWTLAGVALAGLCIYGFDRRVFRGVPELTDREGRTLALALAVVTAPWLFFIPVY